MLRTMLKSKIQQATVSSKEIHYAGSLAIDENLMEAADILCGEQIQVLNLNNGARLMTYAIPAKRGSGTISVKGAAARLMEKGDELLIISYCQIDENEQDSYSHRIVFVDDNNHLTRVEDRVRDDYLENE